MKENLPFQILLSVAVMLIGTIAGYNLIFRESYAVEVRYAYPSVNPSPATDHRSSSTAERKSPASQKSATSRAQGESSVSEIYVTDIVPAYDEFYEEDNPTEDEAEGIVVYFPLELNRASYSELILIPKIGDVTAQRILQYREILGAYENLEQLMDIKGIGELTFETIAPYLYIEGD